MVSGTGDSYSPARELFEKARAAMDEEKLDRVSLGGGVITWLDEGCREVTPPTPDEIVVVYRPKGSSSGAKIINFSAEGTINSVFDTISKPKIYGIGGPETDQYADELAQEILPNTLSDHFLEES
jgi:hypothetical protein